MDRPRVVVDSQGHLLVYGVSVGQGVLDVGVLLTPPEPEGADLGRTAARQRAGQPFDTASQQPGQDLLAGRMGQASSVRRLPRTESAKVAQAILAGES